MGTSKSGNGRVIFLVAIVVAVLAVGALIAVAVGMFVLSRAEDAAIEAPATTAPPPSTPPPALPASPTPPTGSGDPVIILEE